MSHFHQMLWDQKMPRLRLVGSGARAFLNGQTTVDFMEESPPAFLRGFWLNTAGRVRALFEARLIDEGAELLVLGGDFDEVMKGFDQVIFPSDNVQLDWGSEIRRVQLLVTKQPDRFSNVQWILPGDSLSGIVQNLNPSTPLEFARWRMEHGLPIGQGELDARNNPFELGLSNLVNFNKGCYLGQETVAKLLRAGPVRKQLRFWESDSHLSVGQALTSSAPKSIDKKKVGEVIAVMSNKKNCSSFGLAILRNQAFECQELYAIDDLSRLIVKIPIGFVDASSENVE